MSIGGNKIIAQHYLIGGGHIDDGSQERLCARVKLILDVLDQLKDQRGHTLAKLNQQQSECLRLEST